MSVVEVADPVYDRTKAAKFIRKTGTRDFFWQKFTSDNPTSAAWNGTDGGTIKFSHVMNSDWYHLKEMGIFVTFKITKQAAAGDYVAGEFIAPLPDAFFSSVEININSHQLNTKGNKQNIHKWCHLDKLMTYSKEHAESIADWEYFHPDTGGDPNINNAVLNRNTASADRRLLNIATIRGAQQLGATTDNVIVAGVEGTDGKQRGAAATVLTDVGNPVPAVVGMPHPHGNPYLEISENLHFNKGHYARCKINSASRLVTCWIPLKYYVPVLEVFDDLYRSFTLEVTLRRTFWLEQLFGANLHAVGGAGAVTPANGQLNFTQFELQVPVYRPDPARDTQLFQEISDSGYKSVRQYIDVDIIRSPAQFDPASTTTNIDFTTTMEKRPVAVFFAWQFATEMNYQAGNTHRYFNPRLATARLQVDNKQYFPSTDAFKGNATNYDYVGLYREFMKVANLMKETQKDICLDFDAYRTHKFLLAFDLRDAELEIKEARGYKTLRLETTHPAIDTTFEAVPAGIDAAQNGRTFGGMTTGPYYLYAFVLQEKTIEIGLSPSGMSIKDDI